MFKRLVSVLMIGILLAALLCSCSRTAESVTLPVRSVVTSLDPQISGDASSGSIAANCMEGLVRIDETGGVVPASAEDWTVSDDGLTYRFTLRDGLRYYLPEKLDDLLGKNYEKTFDTSVTADDFAFALERCVDPNTESPVAPALLNIENAEDIFGGARSRSELGVSAPDRRTVIIRLARPDPTLLYALAQPACAPCSRTFFRKTAGRYGLEWNLLLCNGPYTIKSMNTTTGTVVLTSNEAYSGTFAPHKEQVRFVRARYQDPNATAAAAPSDDDNAPLDLMTALLAEEDGLDAAVLPKAGADTLPAAYHTTFFDNEVQVLCFSQRSEFGKVRNYRRSLLYATDPELLQTEENSAPGGLIPDCCYASDSLLYREAAGRTVLPAFDLAKAKKYYQKALDAEAKRVEEMREQGMEEKEIAKKTVVIDQLTLICLEAVRTAAQAVVQNWQKVYGTAISVTIKTYETQEELDQALAGSSYDVALTTLRAENCIAAHFMQQFLSTSTGNALGLKDKKLDKALTAMRRSGTANDVVKNGMAAENRLLEQAYLLPVRKNRNVLAVRDAAVGLYTYPAGTVYAAFAAGPAPEAKP